MRPFVRLVLLSVALLALPGCSDEKTPSEPIVEEEGVLVGAGGGVASFLSGSVVVNVPAGSVAGDIRITADPITTPPADDYLLSGTAYEFGPSGTQFDPPARMTISFDAAALPEDATAETLRLTRYDGAEWAPVAENVTVDLTAGEVSGDISSFSSWGLSNEPCEPIFQTSSLKTLHLATGDCIARQTGQSRKTDFWVPTRPSSGILRVEVESSAFSPRIGLEVNNVDYAEGSGSNSATFYVGYPNDVPDILWVTSDESLGAGPYAYTYRATGQGGMPNLGCDNGVFLVPGFVGSSSLGGPDCLITIEQSPDPDAVGKQVYEEYYLIKILAGQGITIEVTRNGGEEEFSPFPTLYTPGQWTQPPGLANDYTLTWTASSTAYYWLGVSGSLRYDEATDDLVPATGGYRISVR